MSSFKVTYATLSADNEDLHAELDRGLAKVRGALGRTYPLVIAGREMRTDATTESQNPATGEVLGRVAKAGEAEVHAAVAAAKAAFPAWRRLPWQSRAEIVKRAATLMREKRAELTAWLILENGKNRVEALGEIEETADLYDYYAEQMHANGGFVRAMGRLSSADTNTSVLRPYGVWAVIAPWNFPYALLGAPMAAALLAGNTVVAKPSSETPISGALVVDIFQAAGVPPGVVNLILGSGRSAGDTLALHPDVAGVTFTGSYDIGFKRIYKEFSREFPKPCMVEMGGKNPAIIMDSADLERAVEGVYRSAFGMGGQKCSACSRVYVHESVAQAFELALAKRASDTRIGDPAERGVYLGPVGTQSAYRDYERYIEAGRADGELRFGGRALREGVLANGYFVEPSLVLGLPEDHLLMREELFLPILSMQTFRHLEDALLRANATPFGLTAGFFSQKDEEIAAFLDGIEAGVVYVNRAAGATTGAWPGVQPFGGWKGSGSAGKNIGGLYSVQCYMREQSRTVTT